MEVRQIPTLPSTKSVMVGLRHDVDTLLGLKRGVSRVCSLEDRFDVRSTFYIRAVLVRQGGNEVRSLLKGLERDGWTIGLHVDNVLDDASLPSVWEELLTLKEAGVEVSSITIHGGLHGRSRAPHAKLCFLGKPVTDYWLQGHIGWCYPLPTFTLDLTLAREGERQTLREAVCTTLKFVCMGIPLVVLTHPEYFVVSVGRRFTMEPRVMGPKVKVLKAAEKIFIALYTVMRRGLVTSIYRDYLAWLRDQGIGAGPVEMVLQTLGLLPEGFPLSSRM